MKTKTIHSSFAEDVLKGLTAESKSLPSKYFYDDNGSRIFMEIMAMPEYYPSACEMEILLQQSTQILSKFNAGAKPFNIVELGSGDGAKTKHLLRSALDAGADFTYLPIDISQEAIDALEMTMMNMPELSIVPYTSDYFDALDHIDNSKPNLLLFLGGNIGNYKQDEALELLQNINLHMKTGDALLIGMDLRKNPRVIQSAYDDPAGITKSFNLNLLRRINDELDADIHLDQFDFYCYYNPDNGEVNSYLVSLKKQHFHSTVLNRTFYFEKDELIWTELSKKYSQQEIDTLAHKAGFNVLQNFMDCRHFFTDSLWIKK